MACLYPTQRCGVYSKNMHNCRSSGLFLCPLLVINPLLFTTVAVYRKGDEDQDLRCVCEPKRAQVPALSLRSSQLWVGVVRQPWNRPCYLDSACTEPALLYANEKGYHQHELKPVTNSKNKLPVCSQSPFVENCAFFIAPWHSIPRHHCSAGGSTQMEQKVIMWRVFTL